MQSEYGLKEPTIEEFGDSFRVVFYREKESSMDDIKKDEGVNEGVSKNEGANEDVNKDEGVNESVKLSVTEKKIIFEIKKEPKVTNKELQERLGVGESTVYRATKKLKDYGMIDRIGSDKNGYWKINEEL